MPQTLGKLLISAMKAVVALGAVLLLAAAALIGILATAPVDLPSSLQAAIMTRIGEALGGDEKIEAGNIALSLDARRLQPELRIADINLEQSVPEWRLSLEEVRIGLDFWQLLNRRPQASSIAVTGLAAERLKSAGQMEGSVGGRTDLADFGGGVLSAIDFARGQGLDRITITNIAAMDKTAEPSLEIADGWMSVTEAGGNANLVGGLSVAVGQNPVGKVRIEGDYRLKSGTVALEAAFSEFETGNLPWLSGGIGEEPFLDAKLDGALQVLIEADGSIARLSGRVDDLRGEVRLPEREESAELRSASAVIKYDVVSRRVKFDQVSIGLSAAAASFDGHAILYGSGPNLWIEGQLDRLELSLSAGNPLELPPVDLSASAMFKLDLDPFALRLAHGRMRAGEAEFAFRGEAGFDAGSLFAGVDFSAESIGVGDLLAIWPSSLAPNPKSWLARNVYGGRLLAVSGSAALQPEEGWKTRVNFQFDRASLTYIPSLPPAVQLSGYAVISEKKAAIRFERGFVDVPGSGRLSLAGSDLTIPDIWDGRKPSQLDLNISGRLASGLSLLNQPPYQLLKGSGIRPSDVDARAVARVKILLPLIKYLRFADVDFSLSGELYEVQSPEAFGPVRLIADYLTLAANPEEVTVSGVGLVNGVPGSGTWKLNIGPNQGRASLIVGIVHLSRPFLDSVGIAPPENLLEDGTAADYFVSTSPEGPTQFGLSAPLDGLGLDLPFLRPTSGTESPRLLLEGKLSGRPELTRISIEGAGVQGEGQVVPLDGGDGQRIELSNLRIGEWFDVAVQIDVSERSGFSFALKGGTVNLRGMPDGEYGLGGMPQLSRPVPVRLDRLIFNSRVTLTDIVGELSLGEDVGGKFTGRINGGQPVGIQVAMTANGLGAYLATNDAGAAMRDAGVVTGLLGGELELSLSPKPEPGSYSGQMRMTYASVGDMPTLTELLSAVTIVGLFDQLISQGISFSEVEAVFDVDRNMLDLKDGVATGPSIGIKMSGNWNTETDIADMDGVITPFNPVSEIARQSPINILGLEKGSGIGGISFKISGPTDNLTTSVNPLSVLTPGFLKDVFGF